MLEEDLNGLTGGDGDVDVVLVRRVDMVLDEVLLEEPKSRALVDRDRPLGPDEVLYFSISKASEAASRFAHLDEGY